MKLCLFTIVLDGMRFLPAQFYTFNRLRIPWMWYVVEGAAANVADTSWCCRQSPRLSNDGTTQFMDELSRSHPNVKHFPKAWWEGGKVQMCNRALEAIHEPCVLMQMDADEMWTAEQLERIVAKFEHSNIAAARFYCNYFVGPNIVTIGENCYGNNPGEWLRAWRFTPGMTFERHEPPVLRGVDGVYLYREDTRGDGLVFDHYAYTFYEQVAYKEQFYGYTHAMQRWCRLQANTQWPCKLKEFLPWVDDRVLATQLYPLTSSW